MPSGVLRGVFFVFIFTALAPILSANSRRHCRNCPRQWYSTSILQDLEGFDAEVTSDPDPSYFCQRYVKTSPSEDGKTAQYDYSYRNAGCNSTTEHVRHTDTISREPVTACIQEVLRGTYWNKLYDNKAFVAASNRVILVYSGSKIYLLDNVYTGYKRDHSCFQKLLEYAGASITFLRDQYICKDYLPHLKYALLISSANMDALATVERRF